MTSNSLRHKGGLKPFRGSIKPQLNQQREAVMLPLSLPKIWTRLR